MAPASKASKQTGLTSTNSKLTKLISQQRILTSSTSKLTKVKLEQLLRNDAAWDTLDLETKQRLYSLLPPWKPGETPDFDVNPLKTRLGSTIAAELRQWQQDLREGRERKGWREEALAAGKARRSGKYDAGEPAKIREQEEKIKEQKETKANTALLQRLMDRPTPTKVTKPRR